MERNIVLSADRLLIGLTKAMDTQTLDRLAYSGAEPPGTI